MRARLPISVAAAAALTAAALLGGAQSASANATGCHDHLCIDVPGYDHYVGKVRVSYTLSDTTVTGRFEIKVDGKIVHHDKVRTLKAGFEDHTWSDAYTFDRNLQQGARICGDFADGDYIYSEACETVG